MLNHPLFKTLRILKGNARACVVAEPIWGISYNLYIPYASLFMVALGLSDAQIGMIASISLVIQTITALLGGVITDKLGRRLVTFLVDLISWAIPCLILAFSQNVYYFTAAAIFNSFYRVAYTSWTCLMVEDADHDLLVDMYAWIYIFAITSAFISPVTGWLVNIYGLVPAMRFIYIISFVLFTAKLAYLFLTSTETAHGLVRMQITRYQSIFDLLAEYKTVIKILLKSPQTLYTVGLMVVMNITTTITNTFWGIIAVQKIQIPEAHIAYFPFIRSLVQLAFFFIILPRISHFHFKKPLFAGFLTFIVGQIILVLVPEKNIFLLVLSAMIDAFSVAMVGPQVDKLTVVTVDPDERARIMSMIYAFTLIISSPFGWIAGELSSLDKSFPFVLNVLVYGVGLVFTILAARSADKHKGEVAITVGQ